MKTNNKQIYKIMNSNLFTIRVYKNEYTKQFIAYCKKVYTSNYESETVLELQDLTEEQCNNIMSVMYQSDDAIKASNLFAGYNTTDDEFTALQAVVSDAETAILKALCVFVSSPAYKGNKLTAEQQAVFNNIMNIETALKDFRNVK